LGGGGGSGKINARKVLYIKMGESQREKIYILFFWGGGSDGHEFMYIDPRD
jgi:hypothetical protein